MEKIIKLYSYVDGINDTPFPSNDNQIESEDFQYNAKRMGGTPSISVSLYWPECIDKSWAYNVYARFNGERYFLKQLPTSGKDNTDARYKYDIELVSERIILYNVYVYDVVSSDVDYDKPVSNGSKFTFFGTIHEFARRLNYSLEYCKVGYSVVVDDGISSEGKMVSFEDQFFSNAIQEAYNTYEIPYYFVGKVIHIGFTNNAITETFKYGAENSLMSIQKQNANYKIVTRVTGTGSSDNIPPYYPNDSADRAAIEAAGGTWILPSDKLMPPVYRDTFGRERFYNAKNNTYTSPQTGDYYHFDNEYVEGNPKEHIVNFEHIKPSIVGMTNSLGFRIDKFVDFAYDTNDNDDVDEEGNYIHPYFFAKLRKMDGGYGFSLFEHAIEGNDMTISMTGGSCGACEWTIMVDEDTMKNTVQVDSDGNILRDENGNVKFGEAQDRQNDTKNYEVWIALKKDIDTFGVVMPNASGNYKPSTDDTFVILHINLPKAYILAAENKLMEEMIKYMATNNNEKFNFSIKFSRIYLEEHPDVLSKLNENARIQIEYDGATVELYVSSFSYKASKSDILPEITVELSDTLTVSQNALQTAINDVKQDIMSSVGSIDWLKLGLAYFLRRDTNDRTRGRLASDVGFEVGRYVSGASGAIVYVDKSTGQTVAELDKLYVRMKAYFEQLEIININSVGGKQILSPAGAIKCNAVEDKGDFYRCYFLAEQDGDKIENRFKSGDQAICKMFNAQTGVSNKISNTYYWRLVTGVGENYIDLSKADCDTGSDEPKAGDVICHKGNRNDTDRQNVIELSSVDAYSPSITLYQGINSYSLVDKEVVQFGVDKTTGKSFMHVYGDIYVGNRDGSSYIKYSPETGVEIKGSLGVGTQLGGKDLSQLITDASNNYKEDLETFQNAVNVSIEGLQGQIDGAIETWFYEPVPTLTNAPASSWTTDADRNKHLGDLYYSGDGRAYRFQYDDAQKTYYWNEIVDTAIVTALENAKKAQDTADGKRRVFIQQPKASDTYDIGDMWVNATYGTTYKNDMLRAKTAKQAGAAFSISHWTLASKYTDDTVANNAKAAADKAQSDVNSLSGTVSGMKDFTDTAFADGVIDRSEKTAIEKYLKQVETVKAQVSKSYTELYANSLLQGTYKTNLKAGHDAFITSATELVNTINTAIEDDKTTAIEKAQVDAKYDTFNSKYGDYVKYLNAAINSIEQALNTSITSYAYLKEALKEDTSITGGLVQTTALVLGYTSSGTYKVMAGSNGYVGGSGEKTIAIWAGGEMVDRELSGASDLTNAADFLVRMDGSGYAASGKLSWNTSGKVTADPLSFFVGENTVGALLASFQVVLKSDGKSPDYLVPQVPFSSLSIANHLALGSAMLKYDAKNNAVYVVKEDGSAVNFYATGGISMYGSGNASGGGGGITVVDGLTSTMTDAALSANMGRVLKEMIDGKSTVTSWAQLEGKPTTVAGFGITDAYTKTQVDNKLTGYLPLSGGTMTGVLSLLADQYTDGYNGALNCNNSDIYGLNSIYTADLSDTQFEGIHFYRTDSTVDTFRIKNGVMYFAPNRALGGTATEYTVMHSGIAGEISGCAFGNAHRYIPDTHDANDYHARAGKCGLWNSSDNTSYTNVPVVNFGLSVVRVNTLYSGQLLYAYNSGNLWYRSEVHNGQSIVWADWKKIAYTSDTVAAAEQLMPRTNNYSIITLYSGVRSDGTSYRSIEDDGYHIKVNGILYSPDIIDANLIKSKSIFFECDQSINTSDYGGEINRFANALFIQYHSSQNLSLCYGGGNVSIGSDLSYEHKLAVTGSIIATGPIIGNHYATATNTAAFVWDKPSSYYTGIGAGNGADIIRLGPCDKSGNWISGYNQQWDFYGNVWVAGGITMYSDLRKKTVIEDVELRLDEIADAPLFAHVYKDDDKRTLHVGSSAQYWDALCPGWFTREDTDGYYMMEIQNCALAAAISLGREVRRYESKTDKQIRKLKRRIAELEDEIELIKKTNQQNA